MEYVIWGALSLVLAVSAYMLGRQSVFIWYLNMEAKHTKEAEELKDEYEMKVKALEDLIEKLEKPEEEPEYRGTDFFAPGTNPEFGLPRKL